ncbi:MAG: 50S ribosomal protein L15 [Puniceicoccales bacterium]|jgi:large subunit ribosomal protein L15|nr:50S ribosomal protein L15 [Puniceicoccales bacterium]
MKLHQLIKLPNATKKRVGRGESSGLGKTSGKGNKGAKARSGYRISPVTSGIPWYRKLPIRGFSNFRFRNGREEVTLRSIVAIFSENVSEIDMKTLVEFRVIGRDAREIKVIGNADLPRPITIRAHHFSKGAIDAICRCGGTACVIATKKCAECDGIA